MDSTPQVNANKSVLVSNLSSNATEKAVSDFFSFCGRISKMFIKREKDAGTAVVEFESESAAKTALLLSNALIVDKPITVTPYASVAKPASPSTAAPNQPAPNPPTSAPANPNQPNIISPENQIPGTTISNKDYGNVADDDRSKTSVIASLLASGYILSQDVAAKAAEIDHQHQFSQQIKETYHTVKKQVEDIDVKLKISTTAKQVSDKVNEQAQKVDDNLKLSEKMRTASQSAKDAASQLNQKVKENETLSKGVNSISTFLTSVKTDLNNAFQDLSVQTQKAIAEKQQQRGTTTTTTDTTTAAPSQPNTNPEPSVTQPTQPTQPPPETQNLLPPQPQAQQLYPALPNQQQPSQQAPQAPPKPNQQ